MAKLPDYYSTTSAGGGVSPRANANSFGGGEGLISLGGAISNTGAVIDNQIKLKLERDATAYVAEQSSALQLNSLKQFEAMKTDGESIDTIGDRFNKQFEEQSKLLIDNAPNGLAKDAMKTHALSIQTNMNEKAIMYQATEKVALQKQGVENSVNNIINSYAIDPGNFNQYRKQLASVQDSSARILTPSDHEAFITKSNSEFATAQVRTILDTNPWQAEKVLKSQEVAAHLTPSAFDSLSNRIDAKKESLQNKAIAQQNKDMKDFQDDSALLAIRNGANPNDPQDIIDKSYLQQPDGTILKVAPNNVSIIPKQQASLLANQLNGINQADEMVAALEQIRQKKGDDYFPIAIKDLKNSGLSPDVAFIAHMDPIKDKNIIDASFAINAAGANKGEGVKVITDMAKTRAATQNDKYSDIDVKIAQNIEDTTSAMLNEGIPANEINNIQTRTSNIANYFYSKGGDMDKATKQATDWINAKYNLGDVNGKKFRAPSEYNINQLESGLDALLKDLKPSDISIANTAGSVGFSLENIKRRGYFTLNGDQTGYILRDEFGIPVRSADRINVFQVPMKSVMDKNLKVQEEINQRKALQVSH